MEKKRWSEREQKKKDALLFSQHSIACAQRAHPALGGCTPHPIISGGGRRHDVPIPRLYSEDNVLYLLGKNGRQKKLKLRAKKMLSNFF